MTGIACLMAAGGGGLRVPLPGGSYTDDVLSPATASASLTVASNGALSISAGDIAQTSWYDPPVTGIGAGYYVRLRVTSGTASSNSASAWTLISANQSITRTQATNGTSTVTFVVEIATDAAGTNIVTSGTYTLSASQNP